LRSLDWVIPVVDEATSGLPVLLELDRGEKQTIILARKYTAHRVIIDERLGRRIAEYLRLNVTGTLGVLAEAKSAGLIPSFHEAAQAMRQQGIHYNAGLISRVALHREGTAAAAGQSINRLQGRNTPAAGVFSWSGSLAGARLRHAHGDRQLREHARASALG
jgi:hypothetical protein